MRVIWGGIVWVSMLLSFLPSRWSPRKQATPAPRYFYFPKQESSLCYIYFFGFFLLLLFILIWFVLIFQFHFTIFFLVFLFSYFIFHLSTSFIIHFVCIHYSFRLHSLFISFIDFYFHYSIFMCRCWQMLLMRQSAVTFNMAVLLHERYYIPKMETCPHLSHLRPSVPFVFEPLFLFLLSPFLISGEWDWQQRVNLLSVSWAQALSRQSEDSALKDRMASLAEELQVLYHRTSQIVIILTDPNVTNFNMIQM